MARRARERHRAPRGTLDQAEWSGFSSFARSVAAAPPRDDGDASDDASRSNTRRVLLMRR